MDEKLLAPGNNIIQQFDAIFGEHPGFRPAHAKGGPAAGVAGDDLSDQWAEATGGLGAPYS
jgi:catalase